MSSMAHFAKEKPGESSPDTEQGKMSENTQDAIRRQKLTLQRMIRCRSRILEAYPLFGQLMMRLRMGALPCGTACTDMTHIIFDPDFADALSDDEMTFVMLHELLHCVLSHCTRGKGRLPEPFNIACDIVVNSCILELIGKPEFSVAGENAMHLTPDGKEGRLYDAEAVYDMLEPDGRRLPRPDTLCGAKSPSPGRLRTNEQSTSGKSQAKQNSDSDGRFDSHDIWEEIEDGDFQAEIWRREISKALGKYGTSGVPGGLGRILEAAELPPQVDWQYELHDYIQLCLDRYDYSFTPPDRRFSDGDLILPSYIEDPEESLENIWFCADASGSISPDTLTEIMSEILQAVRLYPRVSCSLSFFTSDVTDPVPVESEEDLTGIQTAPYGGTSFHAIFDYMRENMEENLPAAVIILTDGWALYPAEDAAMDVPVLWVHFGNDSDAPWGRTIHVG